MDERNGKNNEPKSVAGKTEGVVGALLERTKLFQQLAILAGVGTLAATASTGRTKGVAPLDSYCTGGSFVCSPFSCPAPFGCSPSFSCRNGYSA